MTVARGILLLIFPLALLASGKVVAQTVTSETTTNVTTQASRPPSPPVQRTEEDNFRLGSLRGSLSVSARAEFNNNINLSAQDRKADVALGPAVNMKAHWPISKGSQMKLDMDAGYLWYVRNHAMDTFYIAPNSTLEQDLNFEKVKLNVHDQISIIDDPSTSRELSGRTDQLLKYRRLDNRSGFDAEWEPYKDLSLNGGYDFLLERYLADYLSTFARNDHEVNAGCQYQITPRWSIGILANVTWFDYLERGINDGTIYSFGPAMRLQFSKFIALDSQIGYTIVNYQRLGGPFEPPDFAAPTFRAGLQHQINRRLSHRLGFERSASLSSYAGLNDSYRISYSFKAQITDALSVNLAPSYEHLSVSGLLPEQVDYYYTSLIVGYQFTRLWSLQARYDLNLKDSSVAMDEYRRNRFGLVLTRKF